MALPFPPSRFLAGNFAPVRTECDAPDLVLHGDLPRELAGTLYRNGPNPLYAPRDRYHPFSGDGMLHAFRFENGRVSYRNRWVRTAKWRLEREAGEALFGTLGNPLTSDVRAAGTPFNVANTAVVWHGGRLLALEEGNPPFALDPETLESFGPWTFDGALRGPMTAHPKLDPDTGEMLFFGYGVDGFGSATMSFHVADAAGRLTVAERFEAPYAAMVHDFCVTRGHVVFPIFPATVDLGRALRGGSPIAWEPRLPTRLGVMRRSGTTAALRWLSAEPCYVFHPVNAFERDGTIVADMARYPALPGFAAADGSRPDPAQAEARLERWTFAADGSSDGVRRVPLDDLPMEFPRIDDRAAGLPYRHAFYAASRDASARDILFDTLVHLDVESGRRRTWSVPRGDFVSEPVFVARGPDAPEGRGWLLAVVYRGAEHRSDLVVLDATDVAAGPLATALLDVRVPQGFHGAWRPAGCARNASR